MLLQQPTRGHDHSSLTISALRDLLLKPRALTWMTHVRRQPFNRDKTSKRRRRRGNLAGAHCFSIFEHGACAANADSAAKFRARQSEIVTDEPKQWSIVVSFDNMSGPINREIDLAHDDGSDSDFGLRHERIPACSKLPLTLTDKSGQTESAGSHAGQIDRMLLGIVWRDRRARRNGSRTAAGPSLANERYLRHSARMEQKARRKMPVRLELRDSDAGARGRLQLSPARSANVD